MVEKLDEDNNLSNWTEKPWVIGDLADILVPKPSFLGKIHHLVTQHPQTLIAALLGTTASFGIGYCAGLYVGRHKATV